MGRYTQGDRQLRVESVLGEDELLLAGFDGQESLSAPYSFTLDLRSERSWIDPRSILGQPIGFRYALKGGDERWFHGIVRRFSRVGDLRDLFVYRAEVVPWLWLLSRRTDCRIFQQRTVPQIVREVFEAAGQSDFDFSRLTEAYRTREYCVQYRESDFAFVSRLLEDEGIFYWFRHERGRHELVLADGAEAYEEVAGGRLHRRGGEGHRSDADQLLSWERGFEFRSGRYTERDFNFLRPSDALEVSTHATPPIPGLNDWELYEYPGGYDAANDGDRVVRLRMEEVDQGYETTRGESLRLDLFAGGTFAVGEHPLESERGRSWVVTRVSHAVSHADEWEVGTGGLSRPYRNSFECVPSKVAYRPARRTPRPSMQGVQTAIVVGPSGEELYVDEHARVKVQFHWDRYGRRNESSSCWVRVAQPWAGAGYGGLAIPRIGQEVIVEFEEGDPDRPLINGRLYNGSQPTPVSNAGRDASAGPAPEKITQAAMMTTIRSQSLGGSGGHNEITMNDTGGKEGLFIKAQKDEIHNVGYNRGDTVANNETRKVGVDRIREVGNNETISIGNNREKTVGVDENVSIGSNHSITVGANETIAVGANRTVKVGANEDYTVSVCRLLTTLVAHNDLAGIARGIETGVVRFDLTGLAMADVIGLARLTVVGLADMQVTGLNKIEKIGQDYSLKAGQTVGVTAGKDFVVEASGNAGIKAASVLVFECPDITLKAGGGFIRIDGSGVTISGSLVKINSGGSPGSLPGADTDAAPPEKPKDGKSGSDGKTPTPDAKKPAEFEPQTSLGKFLKKLGVPEKYTKVLDGLIDDPANVKFADLKVIAPSFDDLLKRIPTSALPEKFRGPLANLLRYVQASEIAPESTPEQKKQNEADAKAALDALKDALKGNSKSELESAIRDIAKRNGIDLGSVLDDAPKKTGGSQPGGTAASAGGSPSGASSPVVSHLVDPTLSSSGEATFDVDKAAEYATKNAKQQPGAKCAEAVADALEAGGIKVNRGHALHWGPNLEKAGFTNVPATPETYEPRKGDIVVFQPCEGHAYGHVQIHDGSQFVSDFKQKDPFWPSNSPTSAWKTEKPSFKVYRHP
ncbi:MAG: type VI secretion system tip protein TssI/VgrG [Phycisphaerales bacterium]